MSKFVAVKFLSDKDAQASEGYLYKDTLRGGLKKYDVVLVPTRYGFALATVKGLYSEAQATNLLNNTSSYTRGMNLETLKPVSEKIKSKTIEASLKEDKIKDLKLKLESEVKKIDEVKKFEAYADLSPEVAAMLAQLEELRG